MADKRKPEIVFFIKLNKNKGKTKHVKIELFDSSQFGEINFYRHNAKKYRLRVDGKWFKGTLTGREDKLFLDKWKIRDILWRSLKNII